MSEDTILQKIKSWCAATHLPSTMMGVGDDAAGIFPSGRPLFFSSDLTIEQTHFEFRFSSAADIAWKALARATSDIAAMGAEPLGTTISIAAPRHWPTSEVEKFLADFFYGAQAFSRKHRSPLLGGDLSRTHGSLVIDVAAIGQLRTRGTVWRRSEARPNDLAFVTGTLGAASFALEQLQAGQREKTDPEILLKHLRPEPRFDIGDIMHPYPVNAAIDLSDGLVRDAARLCEASNVSLEIEEARVPGFEKFGSAHSLTGGDDYELLLAIPPEWANSEEGLEKLKMAGTVQVGRFETLSASGSPTVFLGREVNGKWNRTLATSLQSASHDPFRDNPET